MTITEPDPRPDRTPNEAGRRALFVRLLRPLAHPSTAADPAPRADAGLEHELPQLEASVSCRNHGLCAARCSTGALSRYNSAEASGLVFDAARCSACGECLRVCPERALRLVRRACGAAERNDVLTCFATKRCSRCLEPFADGSGSALCPGCRARGAMARSLFGSADN